MHFGLLAVGTFPSFCLGVRIEATKGFGVARPNAEVAKHQKTSRARAFVYQGPALGDIPERRAPRLRRAEVAPSEKVGRVFSEPEKVNRV